MGVAPTELAKRYPCLYHMAEPGTWESIRKHGLLSTSSLLTLFGVEGETKRSIELRRRPDARVVEHPAHGRAVIRDQKPIVESKLKTALQGCSLEEWYALLNARVFFWLTEERLRTLLSARAYRNRPHTVLTVDTLALVKDYEPSITLSPMNSGNTLPIAHPRGPETLKRMADYPFQERLSKGPYYTVVELAVEDGVRNIVEYTLRVDTMLSDGQQTRVVETVYER
jgi:hypothetical protein